MKHTTEELEYFAKERAREQAEQELYDRERREVLIELSALEDKWRELEDRLDATNIHAAILRYAEDSEVKHGPGWIFRHSGDDRLVISGLAEAINRTAMDMECAHFSRIDRLENPDDYKEE
jgi:hypothetical protein